MAIRDLKRWRNYVKLWLFLNGICYEKNTGRNDMIWHTFYMQRSSCISFIVLTNHILTTSVYCCILCPVCSFVWSLQL